MLDNKHEVILHKNDGLCWDPATIPPFSKMTKRTRGCFTMLLNWNVWMRNGKFCWTAFCGMKTAGPYVDKLEPSYGAFRPVIK